MALSFNPQTFFEKTGYYASQGRGVFTLGAKPAVLTTGLSTAQATTVNLAWNLLSSGQMAKSINMPGFTLNTFEEYSLIGPTRKPAHAQVFGPVTVDFYLMGESKTEAASIYNTFVLWHEKIAGPDFEGATSNSLVSDATPFSIAYYDDYTTTASAKLFAPTDITMSIPIIHNKYYEIFPQALGGLTTSWDSPDAPLTLSVTFECYYVQSQL